MHPADLKILTALRRGNTAMGDAVVELMQLDSDARLPASRVRELGQALRAMGDELCRHADTLQGVIDDSEDPPRIGPAETERSSPR